MKRIAIIGTRGVPAKHGGFETFAEEIATKLVKKGLSVTVCCDKNSYHENTFNGIDLVYLSVTKSENPLKYYYEGIKWGVKNSDILLITGTGGSFFYFLNFRKKKIIITNTDGVESKRSKWSFIRRLFVKLTEILAVKFSNIIIADSIAIKNYLCLKYYSIENKIKIIEYGAYINKNINNEILQKHKIFHNQYYLVVSRLEPENNIKMIVEGFDSANTNMPLIIVGNLLDTKHIKYLYAKYNSNRVRFIGGIYNKNELASLRFSCKAYIHGHSIGGTNPSLLEAMGSGNLIICHNNVFNKEVTDNSQLYFLSAKECKQKIEFVEQLKESEINAYKEKAINRIENYYNWDIIANKYIDLFQNIS
ncbi:MAG: DUF1972 domain-containing protein [Bacteroidales bacterium]